MVAAVAFVALLVTLGSVSVPRLGFWLAWSLPGGVAAIVGMLIVSGLVAFAGMAAAQISGWPENPGVGRYIAAGLVAHAALRSSRRSDKFADSLALGAMRWTLKLGDECARSQINIWAMDLSNDALVKAGAELNQHSKGSPSSLRARVDWRDNQLRLLRKGGTTEDEVRSTLTMAVVKGYMQYRLRRPHD